MTLKDAAESALEQYLGDPECAIARRLARAIEIANVRGDDEARPELATALSEAVAALEPGPAKDELIDQILSMGEEFKKP